MNGESSWRGAAFGLGALAASLSGWVLGTMNKQASMRDYAFWLIVPFGIVFGLTAFAWHLPALWASFWWHVRQAEQLRLESARFQHERTSLKFNLPIMPQPTINQYESQWHTFHVDAIQFCLRKLQGDPLYKGGMDGIMDYSAWRKWADGLIRDGMLEPIYQGHRTRWRDTWSAARVLGKLEGGWTPAPCPDEPPPSLKPWTPENARKPSENS